MARTSKSVAAALAEQSGTTLREAQARVTAVQEEIVASRPEPDEPEPVTP